MENLCVTPRCWFFLLASLAILRASILNFPDGLNGLNWGHEKVFLNAGSCGSKVNVLIDAGWYSFSYGSANAPALRSFRIENRQIVQLTITSCFCPGNGFSLFDNGIPVLMTDNQNIKAACAPPVTSNPNDCQQDPLFSHGNVLLLTGSHNITIVATKSPYGGGTAFIRVDTACPNVDFSLPPVPCCQTYNTCSKRIVS